MKFRLALAGAVSVLALAAFPAAGSATSVPGPNGKIVFASGRGNTEVPSPADGNDNAARIWVADYPFGTPVQVTTEPTGTEVQHRHPNWSPDHTRIVYAAGKPFTGPFALWIVDLRTGKQTEFVAAASGQDRPTWSPDGTKIAYGREGDIWVKGVAPGSEPVQITNTAPVDERPVWSPDGNTLYFNRGLEGNRGLFKVSPVAPGGAVETVIDTASDEWQPALSPNGNRLCYVSGPKNDGATLRTVNVNGTGDSPFRDDPLLGDLNCVWSPDGKRILYSEGAFASGQLVSRDINGGDFEALNAFNVEKHFDGNADWATNFSPKCDSKNIHVGVNEFVTVSLTCIDPDFGFGAEPPTPTPLESEAMEIVMGPSHGAIGGLSNGKVTYTPGKDFQGTDAFTYTGTDGTSNAVPASVTIQVGNPSSGRSLGPLDLRDQAFGQEMEGRQQSRQDLQSAGRDDDLVRPQRGGPGGPDVPASPARTQVGQELRQADEREQDPPEVHALCQRRDDQLQRQGRSEQGQVPGTDHQVAQAVARHL